MTTVVTSFWWLLNFTIITTTIPTTMITTITTTLAVSLVLDSSLLALSRVGSSIPPPDNERVPNDLESNAHVSKKRNLPSTKRCAICLSTVDHQFNPSSRILLLLILILLVIIGRVLQIQRLLLILVTPRIQLIRRLLQLRWLQLLLLSTRDTKKIKVWLGVLWSYLHIDHKCMEIPCAGFSLKLSCGHIGSGHMYLAWREYSEESILKRV